MFLLLLSSSSLYTKLSIDDRSFLFACNDPTTLSHALGTDGVVPMCGNWFFAHVGHSLPFGTGDFMGDLSFRNMCCFASHPSPLRFGSGGENIGEPIAFPILLLRRMGRRCIGLKLFAQPGGDDIVCLDVLVVEKIGLCSDPCIKLSDGSSKDRLHSSAKKISFNSSIVDGLFSGIRSKQRVIKFLNATILIAPSRTPHTDSISLIAISGSPDDLDICWNSETGFVKPRSFHGGFPVTIWIATQPTLHMSALVLYLSSNTSGAMKYGAAENSEFGWEYDHLELVQTKTLYVLPRIVRLIIISCFNSTNRLLAPKSASFTIPSSLTNMFDPLMSRCMIWLVCKYWSPRSICKK